MLRILAWAGPASRILVNDNPAGERVFKPFAFIDDEPYRLYGRLSAES